MSGDPLDGLPRPPGEPGISSAAARRYAAAAEELDTSAQQILGVVRGLVGRDWLGNGATSAVGCSVVLAGAVTRAAVAARTAASGLDRYADSLTRAQAQWDRARHVADQALQDEASYRSQAAAQVERLQAQAAGGDLAAAHLAATIRDDAAGYQSPLRARAVSLATDARHQATVAGQQAASSVRSAAAETPVPPPAPGRAAPGERGGGIGELLHWFNDWVLGGANTAGALLTLPPAAVAGGRWMSAASAAAHLPRELQTLFDESVGPLALAADRGLLPWSTVAAKAESFSGAASLFGNASDAAVEESRLAFLRGGLPDSPAFEVAGKGLGVLGIVGDVGVIIEPGGDSAVENGVNRGMAGANAVSTLVVLNATTDEIPIAGEVVMVGTGVYLGGDWLYHHWSPFHDGIDAAANFATDTVPDFVGGVADGAGDVLSSAGHTAGHVLHDVEPWNWG